MRHSSAARPKPERPFRIVLLLTVALLLLPHAARAATIVVDETTCTLIDAILAANTDLVTGGCPAGSGGDTIELTTDVTLTAAYVSPPDVGAIGLPVVTSGIHLQGAGHTIRRDPGAPEFALMVFESESSQLLKDVTLSNGASSFRGGAIRNASGNILTLRTVTVSDNSAYEGGGIANYGRLNIYSSSVSGSSAEFDGGGIWNAGRIYMDDSTISDNSAGRFGGGFFNGCGELFLTNSTVSSNDATFYGGGIDASTCPGYAKIDLENVTVSSNSAGAAGGGLYLRDRTAELKNTLIAHSGVAGDCGILTGAVVIDRGTNFDDDGTCGAGFNLLTGLDPALADNGGPTRTHALLADSSAIDAATACVLSVDQRGEPRDDGDCDSGSYEFQSGPLVVDEVNCNLLDAFRAIDAGSPVGGCVPPRGAATILLTADVTLTRAFLNTLGGIAVPSPDSRVHLLGMHHTIARAADAPPFRFMINESGQLKILEDVTLTNFSVNDDGGAILNHGWLYLTRVTLSGNSAEYGGGIRNDEGGELTMESCTVSGNSASLSGGGIHNRFGNLELVNSTVSGNAAANGGGGIELSGASWFWTEVTLKNVTVAGNTFGGVNSIYRSTSFENTLVAGNGPPGNCAGPSTDLGNNFSDDVTCPVGFGDLTGLDPALADNGGPTLTHALLPESSAIDAAGDCDLETDQRGMPRNDDSCDSGAYEFQCSIELYLAEDLTWIGFTPDQNAFDIVTGNLTDLLSSGSFDDALCMGSYPVSPAIDLLADPDPGEGRYFLAWGLANCSGAGFGNSSLSPDPRDTLDSGPCP